MFGTAVRVAAGWAGSMLVIAVIAEVINNHVLGYLAQGGLLYRSLEGAAKWLPVIVTIAAVLAIVARGLAERRVV